MTCIVNILQIVIVGIGILFSILQTIFIVLGVLIAWWQLRRMNVQTRADFTYRVYRDLLEWLRDHKECRKWIFTLKTPLTRENFDKWEFDDYLGYFETIWSLEKRGLVDEEVVYDILSDYLIEVYEAHNFGVKKIIEELRKTENKKDLYEGVEALYQEMKSMSIKKA